jgi:hypothetical protein
MVCDINDLKSIHFRQLSLGRNPNVTPSPLFLPAACTTKLLRSNSQLSSPEHFVKKLRARKEPALRARESKIKRDRVTNQSYLHKRRLRALETKSHTCCCCCEAKLQPSVDKLLGLACVHNCVPPSL